MDDSTHLAVVPCDKLASKNLLPLFESFQWMCKSKAMANDYIAYCIRCFPPKARNIFRNMPAFLSLNRVKTAPLFDLTATENALT